MCILASLQKEKLSLPERSARESWIRAVMEVPLLAGGWHLQLLDELEIFRQVEIQAKGWQIDDFQAGACTLGAFAVALE